MRIWQRFICDPKVFAVAAELLEILAHLPSDAQFIRLIFLIWAYGADRKKECRQHAGKIACNAFSKTQIDAVMAMPSELRTTVDNIIGTAYQRYWANREESSQVNILLAAFGCFLKRTAKKFSKVGETLKETPDGSTLLESIAVEEWKMRAELVAQKTKGVSIGLDTIPEPVQQEPKPADDPTKKKKECSKQDFTNIL